MFLSPSNRRKHKTRFICEPQGGSHARVWLYFPLRESQIIPGMYPNPLCERVILTDCLLWLVICTQPMPLSIKCAYFGFWKLKLMPILENFWYFPNTQKWKAQFWRVNITWLTISLERVRLNGNCFIFWMFPYPCLPKLRALNPQPIPACGQKQLPRVSFTLVGGW